MLAILAWWDIPVDKLLAYAGRWLASHAGIIILCVLVAILIGVGLYELKSLN